MEEWEGGQKHVGRREAGAAFIARWSIIQTHGFSIG